MGFNSKFGFKSDCKFANTFISDKKDKKKAKKFLSPEQYTTETLLLGTVFHMEKLPLEIYISLQFTKRSITNYVDLINSHVITFNIIQQLKYHKKGVNHIYYDIIRKQESLCYIIKITSALRRFVQIWLYKKYGNHELNTEDPATLSKPEKPIYVYDTIAKGTYIFEASTLKNQFISDISYTDWLVPSIRHPKNPFTNLPFTLGQKIKIINDLKVYTIYTWQIEAYKKHKFNLSKFQEEFYVSIRIKGLDDLVKNTSSDQFSILLAEFVEDQFNYHGCFRKTYLNTIYWAINKLPNDTYIKQWIDIFYKFYRVEIIYGKDYLDTNEELGDKYYAETKILLDNVKEIMRLCNIRLQSITIKL